MWYLASVRWSYSSGLVVLQCTQEDQNYVVEKNSDDYGTKVSAQDAYNFGAAITKAVEEKNLEKLLSFITHKKSFTNSNKILDIENYKGKKC